ncbi:MAG: FkbM family methyltransferase [Deltaproteobacteria bacterium]|nr:FkbM family methyltransferase [Deltaproteobacteria bacterium]
MAPWPVRAIQRSCRAFARVAGVYSGRGRLARARVLRRIDASLQGLQRTTLEDGSLIRVDLSDYMARPVFYFGDFDPKISWVCRRVLVPGDVAIDLGANIGIVAFQMARCVGPTGRVHAFEPQPDLVKRLAEDATANGYTQIVVHPVALSDHDGRAHFNVAHDNCGGAALSDAEAPGYRRIEVEVRRAARVFEGLDLPARARVRLVKLDVEGHEDIVLADLRSWLEVKSPDVVVFEAGATDRFWTLPRVTTLIDAGYRLLSIPRRIFHMRLAPLAEGSTIPIGSHDFVAVHRGAHAAASRAALGLS